MSLDEHSNEQPRREDVEQTDDAWLRRVRDAYTPEPMSAAERIAFDARLEERIERTRRRAWMIGVAGATLVAAAIALTWIRLAPPTESVRSEPTVAQHAPAIRPASLRAWQDEVIAAADPERMPGSEARDSDLPAEYQALDSLFLAGASGGQHGR